MERFMVTRKEAIARLTRRYNEQVEIYPKTHLVPLQTFIKRNIRYVRVYNGLEEYASK